LPTLRVFELLLEIVNLSLELELFDLGGELLHMRALWSAILGGGLATGAITLGWKNFHIIPSLRHHLSKRSSLITES
jgi:hypothetical protein